MAEENEAVLLARYVKAATIGVAISILIGYKQAANSCWFCFRYVIPTDNSFYIGRSDVYLQTIVFIHADVTSYLQSVG